MNKNLYRVIFNAARGLMVVVQETASGFCKGGRSGRVPHGRGTDGQRAFTMLPMRGIAFAALCVFGFQPVLVRAQVVAAPNASPATKPAVGVSGNGIPLVQITTPNAAGVSNNTYTQYNVGTQGLILNNSPSTVQTKLGGYVQGNPYLTTGGARIILNQVVGGSPSQLLGYTEVAGQQAEVIIANPAGLYCNGCGFINTTRGVLTTGTPMFGGTGSLDAFHVTSGQIQIGTAGLNASNVDQVDLIARSVQVNGKVWAGRQLDVVTGANDVNHADLSTHVLAPDGNAPSVAIDVAQLGGMYAGKIVLVGTEAGVGVNSLGTIQAQAGDVQLSNAGKVTLAGSTSASGNVQIQSAGDISNTGSTYAAQNATLISQGAVTNSGSVASLGNTTVGGTDVVSTGALGAGVDSGGNLTGSGNLAVNASGAMDATGRNLAGGALALTGSSLNMTGAQTVAGGSATLTATGAGGDTGNVTLTGSNSNVAGSLGVSAAGELTNDRAQTSAGQLTATAGSLSNRGGQLAVKGTGKATLSVTGDVDNTRGAIEAAGAASLTAANVTNAAGRIVSLDSDGLTLTASGQVTNTAGATATGAKGGVIGGNGDVTLHGASLTNSGTVTAGQALKATVADTLDNSNGAMIGASVAAGAGTLKNVHGAISGSTVGLTIPQLDNSGGTITSNQLTVSSTNLTNEGGTLTQLGTGPMSMTVSNALDNSNGGVLQTNSQDLTLAPASLNNNGGTITHAGTGTLTIDSGSGSGLLTNAAGKITTNGQAMLSVGSLGNAGGTIASGKALTVTTGGNVDNTRGTLQAGGAASVTAEDVTNAAGRIVSLDGDGLTLAASGKIINSAGTTAQGAAGGVIGGNGNVTVSGAALTNGGTLTAGQALKATVSAALDNSNGTMSGAAVTANASSLKNVRGTISGSTISLAIPQLDNSGGTVTANQLTLSGTNLTNEGGTLTQLGSGTMSLTISNAIDNSNGGLLQTNSQDLALAPASLDNSGGTITHAGTGTLTIDAGNGTGSFKNVGGTMTSNGQVDVAAGGVQNAKGSIASGKALTVHTAGDVDNTQGTLQAGGAASVSAANVTNAAGRIVSLDSDGLTLTASGQVTNTAGATATGAKGGVIGGNGDVTLHGASLTNSGTVTAGQALKATVADTLDNSNGAMIGASVAAGAGTLKNVHGAISGSTVGLTIPQLDNSGGTITSNQLTVSSTNLTNEGGTLTQLGTGPMSMTVSNALDNSNGGVLQTNSQDLTLAPASLNNNGGTITHAGTGTLTIESGSGYGTLTNVSGKIVSNGNATVSAGVFTNAGGTVRSRGAMSATVAGAIDNTGGLLHSDTSLTARSGAALTNIGGRINVGTSAGASNPSTLSLSATSIDNTNGSILDVGSGAMTISGTSQIVNSNAAGVSGMGSIGGNGRVTLTTATLTNTQGGQLSGASLQVNADTLNNTGGQIGNVANTTGDIGITTTGIVYNGSGQISAQRNLSLTASTLAGGGVYNAANDVTLNLQGDFANAPGYQFNAGQSLTFNLPGTFSNGGNLVAFSNLAINAGNVVNSGAITAGGLLSTSSATLTNTGSLVGGSVSLNAWQSISNLGPAALIGATDSTGILEVLAPDIENRDDTTATDTAATTMIYGLGKVVLAGGKDANGNYTNANLIRNQSALIQSGGDMTLGANQVTNTRRDITTTGVTSTVDPALLTKLGISMSGCTAIYMAACSGQEVGWVAVGDPNLIGGAFTQPPHSDHWNSGYQYTTYSGVAVANTIGSISPKSQIVAGGNLDASSTGTFQNYWSQVTATGNIASPAKLDQNSWRGQTAPGVQVTYSGEYHYNNYNDNEHNWQLPFGDAKFVTVNPGGYTQAAPADIRHYALPGYESTFTAGGTLSGTGVTINNTAGNAGVTPLNLAPGQSVTGTSVASAVGSVANAGSAVSDKPVPQAVAIRGVPGGNVRLAPTTNTTSTVSANLVSVDPVLGKATALPVLTNLTVPQGGLFKPDIAPNPPYLVETNPAFANLHQWLSSDYYFQQMGMDPSRIQMRLGDGFYEQHLVQSQIMSLTGKAVLTNYADTQSEFEALMASGATLSKSLNLAVGMGLSAEQVEHLTSNVVLMQSEVVDGKTVLVPVVYLAQASQENMGNGPVIAATDIDLEHAQGITNSGTIRAANNLTLAGQSIDSTNGTLQSGSQMTLATLGDINLTGGTLAAGGLSLKTGGNLILDTAVNTLNQVSDTGATRVTSTLGPVASISVGKDALISVGGNFDQKAAGLTVGGDLTENVLGNWTLDTVQIGEHKVVLRANGISDTNLNQSVGSGVSVGGHSKIEVGGDLTATGSTIDLHGGGTVAAAGNVSLLASTTTSTTHSSSVTTGSSRHSSDDIRTSDDFVQGTTLESGQNLIVKAGKDLTITGSTVDVKKGTAMLTASGDVNIGAATETHFSDVYESGSHSGFGSKSSHVDHVVQTMQTADGSTISADSVGIVSGRNLTIQGSGVAASNDLALRAKGNIDITAAQDTFQDSELHDVKHSGFTGTGGNGIGYGSSEQKDQYTATAVTQSQARSAVGSVAGNVSITADGDVHIAGSDVTAGKAKSDTKDKTGNITVQGQNIAIDPGQDDEHSHDQQDAHSSGFAVAVAGTPLDTVRNLHRATSSGNGFQRLEGASNEMLASAFDVPSPSVSFSHSSSSSTTDLTSVTNTGSTIRGGGNVSLVATGGAQKDDQGNPTDGDITVMGSTVTAGGVAELSANRNVTLEASTDQSLQSMQSSSSSSSFSLASPSAGDSIRWVTGGANSGGVGPSPYNTSRAQSNGDASSRQQTASAVIGNSVVLKSKTGNIDVVGSGISGTQGVDVIASQGAIDVSAGTDTSRSHQESSNERIGDLGSNGTGTGFSVGVSKNHMAQDAAAQTQSTIRSQIVSKNGNVSLRAQQDLTVQGSDLSAGKDLSLTGLDVKIDPGTDAAQSSMSQSASQFGVTTTIGGALGNAVATINQSMAAARHTDNQRLAKLDEAQAALSAYGAYQATSAASQNLAKGPALVKVTASIGGGTSHSESESNSVTNDGSTLKAGGNVTIAATGSGAKDANGKATDGDIVVRGAHVTGGNVELNAARDVDLESAQDTNHETSQNSSSGGSVGVGFTYGGQQNGFSLELSAYGAKGHVNGNGTTNRDTQVTASQTLSITSGRDTNLRGAEVSGDKVDANVGRDLNIVSQQDTNTYDSKQTSAGVQLSICVPPFCYGTSGSGSANQQTIKDNYKSVDQQSGIYAGTGGFDVHVGNHTELDGGAISSKAGADKNTLSTQTLGFTDLQNKSEYSGTSVGFSASGGVGFKTPGGKAAAASGQTPGSQGAGSVVQTPRQGPGATTSGGLGPSGFGVAGTSSSESGTTYAAVSPGSITVRGDAGTGRDSTAGLSRDTTHANDGALSNTFDAQKVGDDLAVQTQTVQVGMQVAGDVGAYLEKKAQKDADDASRRLEAAKKAGDPDAAAQAQADLDSATVEQSLWKDDGGAARTGLHTVVAGLGAAMGGGNVLGAVGGTIAGDEASAAVNSAMDNTLGANIFKNVVSGVAGAAAGAVLGGASGAVSGANGSLGADLYNRQLHSDKDPKKDERQWAKDHAKDFAKYYERATGGEITQDEAEKMLLANGYIKVDASAASTGLGYDATAAEYLRRNANGLFVATPDEYKKPFLYGNADGTPTPEQLAMPGGTAHPVVGAGVAVLVTGGLALGPEAAAGAAAAVRACAANPVLCGNQAAIAVGDVAAGSAMPAGTGAAVAGTAGAVAEAVSEAGPAKTASGDLNVAGNSARSQPYGNGASASPSPGTNAAGSSGASAQLPSATNAGSLTTAEKMAILREAAAGGSLGKGNFSLGQATADEANELGAAWVGPGYRVSSDGSSWVSSDGLKIYRPPSAKPNSSYATTGVQANFESKLTAGSRPISNGHLNITP